MIGHDDRHLREAITGTGMVKALKAPVTLGYGTPVSAIPAVVADKLLADALAFIVGGFSVHQAFLDLSDTRQRCLVEAAYWSDDVDPVIALLRAKTPEKGLAGLKGPRWPKGRAKVLGACYGENTYTWGG